MKISIGPGKGKKQNVEKITYMSPSGRDSDNQTFVKSNTAIPGVTKWRKQGKPINVNPNDIRDLK